MINTKKLRLMRKLGAFNHENRNMCDCSACETQEIDRILDKPIKTWLILGVIGAIAIVFLLLMMPAAHAQEINIAHIAAIESHNNPHAYNKHSHAIGLCQITETVLIDYNEHFGTNWKLLDLYNMDLNMMVASWYLNDRIPAMLKYYKIANSVRNRLIAYNYGIGHLKHGDQLPKETIDYILKYEEKEN